MKRESEFSKAVLDALAKRVGCRCSNPSCRKLTTGPRSDSASIVCIGVGAHIHAVSPGGPRFDPALEQRSSAENGIWLCQNCGKLVDNDSQRYTAERLREWKERAEAEAHDEVEGRKSAGPSIEDAAELELADKKVSIRSERHDYVLNVNVRNLGNERLTGYHVDLEMPAAFVEHAAGSRFHVPGRSSRERVLFRSSGEELYPGDAFELLSIPYFVDDKLYWDRAGVFDETVKATLYRPGLRPMTVERPFDGMQNF